MPREFGPDDFDEVYAAIGAAVWHMQFLEDALVMYITMRLKLKLPGAVDMQAALAELETQRKKTLGKLLEAARAGNLVHGETEEAFRILLNERNWLVHRSMHESSESLETHEGVAAFLERVRLIEERSIALKKVLTQELFAWLKTKGLDVDRINAATEAQFWTKRGIT